MTKQCFGSSAVPLSPAVRAGDFVFISGQVPVDDKGQIVPGGIKAETEQVLKNVESALKLAGCALSDVVKTTVFLTDMATFSEMNTVYATFFADDPPARAASDSARYPCAFTEPPGVIGGHDRRCARDHQHHSLHELPGWPTLHMMKWRCEVDAAR